MEKHGFSMVKPDWQKIVFAGKKIGFYQNIFLSK